MSAAGLETTAARLRAAIEEGAYGPALALLPTFRRQLDAALAAAPPGGPEARAIAAGARELLEWSRRTTLCAQAHMAAQLEALACLNAYGATRRKQHSWAIDG